MGVHQTKTFMSGNSVAVRLPRDLGVDAGTLVTIERKGGQLVLKPVQDHDSEAVRQEMRQLLIDLQALRVGVVQQRDVVEFPDRERAV